MAANTLQKERCCFSCPFRPVRVRLQICPRDAADTLRIWARGRPVDGGAERALLPRGELRVGLLGESAMHLPVEVEIERAFFYGDTTKALGGGGGGV